MKSGTNLFHVPKMARTSVTKGLILTRRDRFGLYIPGPRPDALQHNFIPKSEDCLLRGSDAA